MRVRFDDARPDHQRGFALEGIVDVLVAHDIDEVADVVRAAEAAVGAGATVGGWLSYEAGAAFDPHLSFADRHQTPFADLPLAWFAVAESTTSTDLDAQAGDLQIGAWTPGMSATTHAHAVAAIRDHIRDGTTYQVNLTFQLHADVGGDPVALYRQLVASQSGGYGALLDTGRWVVASASPELFLDWHDGIVTARPMKGTTARGPTNAADAHQRGWLASSTKNQAENVMIVDMVRNDLARVAEIGSVTVPDLFVTEKYDTLWQLTSTVTARTRPDVELVDLLRATFPSASITGAPKVSTTRIIADLETGPRGVYCGAIGFGFPDHAVRPGWTFNVGIRTVVVDTHRGVAHYGTGGGITYDSDPADEHREARLKAEVLRRRTTDVRLLETMRWDPADPTDAGREGFRHLQRHLDRLAGSARWFDVPVDDAAVRSALDRAVADRDGPTRVRLTIDRRGGIDVEVTSLSHDPGWRGPGPPPGGHDRPLLLAVDDQPVDPDDVFLHHKTTARAVYDAARARHPDADDVVLVNDRDEVTETCWGNLVVCLDDGWATPPTTSGLLAGTERAARLAAGELREQVIMRHDLDRAQHVGRLNAVRGWQTARLA